MEQQKKIEIIVDELLRIESSLSDGYKWYVAPDTSHAEGASLVEKHLTDFATQLLEKLDAQDYQWKLMPDSGYTVSNIFIDSKTGKIIGEE